MATTGCGRPDQGRSSVPRRPPGRNRRRRFRLAGRRRCLSVAPPARSRLAPGAAGGESIRRVALDGQQGWAGAANVASSVLSLRASALSASLEPLIPLLRKARRDTGFPCAASRRATRRPGSVPCWPTRGPGLVVPVVVPWSRCGAAEVSAAGPAPVSACAMTAWSGPGRFWS